MGESFEAPDGGVAEGRCAVGKRVRFGEKSPQNGQAGEV